MRRADQWGALFFSIAGNYALYIGDIGDLLMCLRERKTASIYAQARDSRRGEWIETAKTFSLPEARQLVTPRGWEVALFKDKKKDEDYGARSDITAVSGRPK